MAACWRITVQQIWQSMQPRPLSLQGALHRSSWTVWSWEMSCRWEITNDIRCTVTIHYMEKVSACLSECPWFNPHRFSLPLSLYLLSELCWCSLHCSPRGSEVWCSYPSARSHCEQTVRLWVPVHHQWGSSMYCYKSSIKQFILSFIYQLNKISLNFCPVAPKQKHVILCVCRRFVSKSQRWSCVEARRAWARPPTLFATYDLAQGSDLISRWVSPNVCHATMWNFKGSLLLNARIFWHIFEISTVQLEDTLWAGLTDLHVKIPMGITAENLAEKYQITREDCDNYAHQTQQRWKAGEKRCIQRTPCSHTWDTNTAVLKWKLLIFEVTKFLLLLK